MRMRSVAIAALSTALGIAVLEASEAVSAFVAPVPARVEAPRVPSGYDRAEVHRVLATDSGPVVLVRRAGEDRALPIWVGTAEGRAIARGLHQIEPLRPLTHDLFAAVVAELGAEVHHVRVDSLRPDGWYVGSVVLATSEGPRVIDARPSDALALALRTGAPVYLAAALEQHMLALDPEASEESRGVALRRQAGAASPTAPPRSAPASPR